MDPSRSLSWCLISCFFHVLPPSVLRPTRNVSEPQVEAIQPSLGVGKAKETPQPPRVPSDSQSLVHSDRKSTRLNSSHANISYAVFCLKKKKHPSLGDYC